MTALLLALMLVTTFPFGERPDIRAADLERQIHTLINKERRNHNLPPVAWNEALAGVARSHSADMAHRGFFSHVNPSGENPHTRTMRAVKSCKMTGENLYQMSLYSRVIIRDGKKTYQWKTGPQLAADIVKGWMGSAGHRRNILTKSYTSSGIGVAISNDDVYVTQVFCG